MNNCIFTITAKNYLAQALTLKESIKVLNPQIDFYIFLADINDKNIEIENLIELNESWIPNYKSMAFKYNLIEFTTSIKPFCFQYLFKKNYNKVIYFDPDIFLYQPLDFLFNYLENYDIILTPHRIECVEEYNIENNEESFLFAGIFNLGFIGICNSIIGNKIINWWKNRLYFQCYGDKNESLHVDQKWIDFIPSYFPKNLLVLNHIGCNFAYWNKIERNLFFEKNNWMVKNKITKEVTNLIFFHFSGFMPTKPTIIHSRIPDSKINNLNNDEKKLLNDYAQKVTLNNYNIYSSYKYNFNFFSSNNMILPIHRRLYRVLLEHYINDDCFNAESKFYGILKKNKLIYKKRIFNNNNIYVTNIRDENKKLIKFGLFFLKIFLKIFGVKYYTFLLKFLEKYSKLENNIFILNKNK